MLLAFAGTSIQLVPDGTILFHLLLIIIMVALLNATLLKPINRILEERDKRTKGRLSEAQITMLSVSEKLREYESGLREARSEGYALMERERAVLAGERDKRVAQVREQMGRETLNQREKLKAESEQAKVTLKSDAQALAVKISSQILHRPVSGQGTT